MAGAAQRVRPLRRVSQATRQLAWLALWLKPFPRDRTAADVGHARLRLLKRLAQLACIRALKQWPAAARVSAHQSAPAEGTRSRTRGSSAAFCSRWARTIEPGVVVRAPSSPVVDTGVSEVSRQRGSIRLVCGMCRRHVTPTVPLVGPCPPRPAPRRSRGRHRGWRATVRGRPFRQPTTAAEGSTGPV
jgi:hypothetical protein